MCAGAPKIGRGAVATCPPWSTGGSARAYESASSDSHTSEQRSVHRWSQNPTYYETDYDARTPSRDNPDNGTQGKTDEDQPQDLDLGILSVEPFNRREGDEIHRGAESSRRQNGKDVHPATFQIRKAEFPLRPPESAAFPLFGPADCRFLLAVSVAGLAAVQATSIDGRRRRKECQ